jgi:hypothetical protein
MQVILHAIRTIFDVFLDVLTFVGLCFRPTATIAAENLFLRKQLGLFVERKVKPRRATDAIRYTLARLSRVFDWRNALTIVKPDTLIRGIPKASVCFGNGNLSPADDLPFRPNCES